MEDLLQPEINAIHFLKNRRKELRVKKHIVKADLHLTKSLEEARMQRKQKGTFEAEVRNESESVQVEGGMNTSSYENCYVGKGGNGNIGSSNKNATTSKKKPRWKWMVGDKEREWQLNLMLAKLESKINEKICLYTQWWKQMKATSIILANEKYKMYTTLGEYLSKDIIESLIFVCKKCNFRRLDALLFILMPCRSIHGKVLNAYRNYYDYMKNIMTHRYFRICKVWTKNQRILLQKWDAHRMNFVAGLVAKHSSDEYSATVENIMHHLNRQSYRLPKKRNSRCGVKQLDEPIKWYQQENLRGSGNNETLTYSESGGHLGTVRHGGFSANVSNVVPDEKNRRFDVHTLNPVSIATDENGSASNNIQKENIKSIFAGAIDFTKVLILQSEDKYIINAVGNLKNLSKRPNHILFMPDIVKRKSEEGDRMKNVVLLKINKILIENNIHIHLMKIIYKWWNVDFQKKQRTFFSELGSYPYFDDTRLAIYFSSLSILLHHYIIEQFSGKLYAEDMLETKNAFLKQEMFREICELLSTATQYTLQEAISAIHYFMFPDQIDLSSNIQKNFGIYHVIDSCIDVIANQSCSIHDPYTNGCSNDARNEKDLTKIVKMEDEYEKKFTRRQERRIEKIAGMWKREYEIENGRRRKGLFDGDVKLRNILKRVSFFFKKCAEVMEQEKDKRDIRDIKAEEGLRNMENVVEIERNADNTRDGSDANSHYETYEISDTNKKNPIVYSLYDILMDGYEQVVRHEGENETGNNEQPSRNSNGRFDTSESSRSVGVGNDSRAVHIVFENLREMGHHQKNNTLCNKNSKAYNEKMEKIYEQLYTTEKKNLLFTLLRLLKKLHRFNNYTRIFSHDFFVLKGTSRFFRQRFVPAKDTENNGKDTSFYEQYPYLFISPEDIYLNKNVKYVDILLNFMLKKIPFTLKLEDRVMLFYNYVNMYRINEITSVIRSVDGFPDVFVIRRNELVKDAYTVIQTLKPHDLRKNLKIMFIDKFGMAEGGIDGGGLFKEFLILTTRIVFGKEFILYQNENNNTVFPLNYGKFDNLNLYRFSGRLVGKALMERITIDPFMNEAFLNLLLYDREEGKKNLNDVYYVDQELFHNLLHIQTTENIDNYTLTFSLMEKFNSDETRNNINWQTYKRLTTFYRMFNSISFVALNRSLLSERFPRFFNRGRRRRRRRGNINVEIFSRSESDDSETQEFLATIERIRMRHTYQPEDRGRYVINADDDDFDEYDSEQNEDSANLEAVEENENEEHIRELLTEHVLEHVTGLNEEEEEGEKEEEEEEEEEEEDEEEEDESEKDDDEEEVTGEGEGEGCREKSQHAHDADNMNRPNHIRTSNRKKKVEKKRKRAVVTWMSHIGCGVLGELQVEQRVSKATELTSRMYKRMLTIVYQFTFRTMQRYISNVSIQRALICNLHILRELMKQADSPEHLYDAQFDKGLSLLIHSFRKINKLYTAYIENGKKFESYPIESKWKDGLQKEHQQVDQKREEHKERQEQQEEVMAKLKAKTKTENDGDVQGNFDGDTNTYTDTNKNTDINGYEYGEERKDEAEDKDDFSDMDVEKRWRIEEVDSLEYDVDYFMEKYEDNGTYKIPQEHKMFIEEYVKHGDQILEKPRIFTGEEEEEKEQDVELEEADDNDSDDDDFTTIPEEKQKNSDMKQWEIEWESEWIHGEGERDAMFDGYFSHVSLEHNTEDSNSTSIMKEGTRPTKKRKIYQGCTDLIKNGRNVLVNDSNKEEYIKAFVNYKYKQLVQKKTKFFARGIHDVLPLQLLKIFTAKELSVMISGNDRCFEVADLKQNVTYCGYTVKSKTIINLYEVLEEFTPEQKSLFLMFVTSCSRPPLLGFKELAPKICISKWPSTNSLPSAATCVNLLKLPDYATKEQLKANLLMAISETHGFDLQ